MNEVNIPAGTSSFAEIRRENYYFIDKSGLIGEILKTRGTKVTCITRPRRFGKTLGMSMLSEFFDIRKDSRELFEGLSLHSGEMKEWYDGYHFGSFDVYCPWDVMNHVKNLLLNPQSEPDHFWENTSGNEVIRTFLNRTDFDVNDKFEILLAGGYIEEPLEDRLTYDMLASSEENLWSLLYMTGYLTIMRPSELSGREKGKFVPGLFALKIPNREIADI